MWGWVGEKMEIWRSELPRGYGVLVAGLPSRSLRQGGLCQKGSGMSKLDLFL